VGPEEAPALLQLQMTHHEREWAMLEPAVAPGRWRWQHGAPLDIARSLRRRYYLVEKAKNASIVGKLSFRTDSGAFITNCWLPCRCPEPCLSLNPGISVGPEHTQVSVYSMANVLCMCGAMCGAIWGIAPHMLRREDISTKIFL